MLFRLRILLLTLTAAAFIGGCGTPSARDSRPEHTGTVPRSVVGVMIVYREALTLIDQLKYADAAAKLGLSLRGAELAERFFAAASERGHGRDGTQAVRHVIAPPATSA